MPEEVQRARVFDPFKPSGTSTKKNVQGFDFPARNKVPHIPKGFAVALGEPSPPPSDEVDLFRRGLDRRPLHPFGRSFGWSCSVMKE